MDLYVLSWIIISYKYLPHNDVHAIRCVRAMKQKSRGKVDPAY